MGDTNRTREELVTQITEMQTFLEGLPHKVFVKDRDSVYLFCNENYARDLGQTPDKVRGKTDYDFYPRELAEKYRADDKRVLESGEAEEMEERYIQGDREFVVSTHKRPVKDREGRILGVMGFFWDITRYKLSEEKAHRQNSVLNGINRIFREALTSDTEKELASTCLKVAEELTESQFGFIGEINPSGRLDTLALSDPGWESCKMPQSEISLLITNMEVRGIWGEVVLQGQPLIVNDPHFHPASVGLPKGHPDLTSFLGVPLMDGGRVTGIVALANKEKGYLPSGQEAVEALSVAILEALRTKRLGSKIAQQSQEIMDLSTPVVQVWEGIVIAPLIGILDSDRTQRFMERFLNGIVETRSSVALVDITGVPHLDTQTAQHLTEAITAARLLGTRVILTGVRPAIAQTLVHLGIDLSGMETCASLIAGLRLALDMMGLQVTGKEVPK